MDDGREIEGPDKRERGGEAAGETLPDLGSAGGVMFRRIIDSSGDSITVVDLQGRVVFANRGFTDLSGWTEEEVKGRKLPMTLPSLIGEEERLLAQAARGIQIKGHETIKRRKDGSTFHADVSISPVFNESGEVVAISRITRDISELKTLEKSLKESNAQYRALFESSREAIYVSTPRGDLIEMNPFGLELFGYPLEELRRVGITALYADPREREKFVAALLEKGFVKDFAVDFRKKSGDRVRAMISASLFNDNQGRTYFQGIIKDQTAILNLEDELRELLKEKELLLREIRKNEQWLATTIASIGDALIATDRAGRVVFMNPVAELLTGWAAAEAVGMDLGDVFRIVNETTRNPVENPAARAIEQGVIVGLANHTILIKRGGGDIPIDDSAAPIFDEQGGILGAVLVFRDVSSRRKAEGNLKRLEKKYRDLFNEAPVMYVLTRDEEGIPYVADCSESFLKSLKYSRDEVFKAPLTDLYTPESREKSLGGGYRRAQNGVVVGERGFVAKDGRVIHTQLNASPELDGEGKTVGVRAIYTDITARKEAEERLEESEGELRGLFGALDDRIMLVDRSGRYLKIAPTARLSYSRPPEEMLGKTYRDIFPREKADFFFSKLTEAFETGQKVECEYQLPNLKGEERWFNGRITPLDGEKALWVARDITELKEAELHKTSLEGQIQQLAKLEAIGRLAGGVAHDFNNILQAISGYVELIGLKLTSESPLREEVEEIGKAASRAATLTRQLLAFSRKSIMKMEAVNLDSLVGDIEKMLRRLIGEDIDLEIVPSRGLPLVEVDVNQFEQVIINLSVNARDAMPEGGKLTIETASVHLDESYAKEHSGVVPGDYVMLSVSDTGVGMTQEIRAKLFEPFFTTKEKGRGTGLGLASIYGIVKQSGGNIWVYSEAGRGTTFKIYLPALGGEAELSRRVDFSPEPLQGEETVLVVEDEENVRRLASLFLNQLGYTVLEAADPKEALKIARDWPGRLDLVLTDVIMPGMNGRELELKLRRIREDFRVLYMSGYTENTIVHHGVLGSEVRFIQKPFNLNELSLKVRETLDEGKRLPGG